jgi:hypothetical protein
MRGVIVKIVLRVADSGILRTSFNFPVKATSMNVQHLMRTHILNGVTHGITQMRVLNLDPGIRTKKTNHRFSV